MPAAEARQTSNVRMGCGGLERARGIERQYSRDNNGSRERYWPAADTRLAVASSKPGTARSRTIAGDREAWMMMAKLLLASGGVLGLFREAMLPLPSLRRLARIGQERQAETSTAAASISVPRQNP